MRRYPETLLHERDGGYPTTHTQDEDGGCVVDWARVCVVLSHRAFCMPRVMCAKYRPAKASAVSMIPGGNINRYRLTY